MSAARLRALVWRELLEIRRDRFRLAIAFTTPIVLLVVLGYGLSIDVEGLPYGVLDRDRTPASRGLLEAFRSSRSFAYEGALAGPRELETRLRSGELAVAIRIPRGFGRALERGEPRPVAYAIDGSIPFEASMARGYVEALHEAHFAAAREGSAERPGPPVGVRFWFNPALESRIAFVPGLVAALLVIVPAMLTAVAVVREKEQGSIANLYATPMARLEFLLGKQIPYALLSVAVLGVLVLLAVGLFGLSLRGSALALAVGGAACALAATGLGLVVSCFTRTQIAALMVAVLVTLLPSFLYSGFFTPVSSLSGLAWAIASAFPARYFLEVAVGSFSKGLGLAELWRPVAALLGFAGLFLAASVALLPEQRR